MIRLPTLLVISLFFALPIPLGGNLISSTEASSLLKVTTKQFSLLEQKRYSLVSSAPKSTSQPDTSWLPKITQVVIEMTCEDLKTSDDQSIGGASIINFKNTQNRRLPISEAWTNQQVMR